MSLKEMYDKSLRNEGLGRSSGFKNLHRLTITDGIIETVNWLKCEYTVFLVDRKETVSAYLAFNKNFWLMVGFPQRGDRVLVTHSGKEKCQIIASFDKPSEYALSTNSNYEDNCFIAEGVKSAG